MASPTEPNSRFTPSLAAMGDAEFDQEHPLPVFHIGSDDPLPELEERELAPLPERLEAPATSRAVERSADGSMWLNGEVLMCPCPDCRAPMTIRLWLMIADCWKCGVSIELTEEQEREAKRLLAKARERQKRVESPAGENGHRARSTPQPADRGAASPASSSSPSASPTRAPSPSSNEIPPPPPAEAPQPARRRRRRRRDEASTRTTSARLNRLLRDTPAWMISLVFHLVLLTLLGILQLPGEEDDKLITLSTTVSAEVREGGDTLVVDPLDEVKFDLPIPPEVDLLDKRSRESFIRADQDARELRLDPNTPQPDLPKLDTVKSRIAQAGEIRQALMARDLRVRVDMVKKEGGTTRTEAAVARGLRWLSRHQNADGSWSLHNYRQAAGRRCDCRGSGVHSDSAGTALALLPFLGAGQTHLVGVYRDTVAKGLRWLVEHQRDDGDLRVNSSGNAGMYAHGQATIVLCEAFLMTGDEQLRIPAQKAVNFVVAAQHAGGGWRYRPGQAGDTSVLGWQLMALQSARAANLTTPEEAFALADHYLDTVSSRGGALYSYQPGQRPTPAMTAEALLCRMYLGWKRDDPGMREGVNWLADNNPPLLRAPNIYYWYYASQALHHHGGTAWERWNIQMRDVLVGSQQTIGHAAGSWEPRGPHAGSGGRIYMTALSVCTLEVYYRHLPIFRQINLEQE